MGRYLHRRRMVALTALLLVLAACTTPAPKTVEVVDGRLYVEGEPYTVLGMNWSCYPVGKNYSYIFWNEPDSVVTAQLDYEMGLMRDMGVNTVRIYNGIPPRWITYIWENYGIRTMVNCTHGRYGMMVRGEWDPHTDYSDPGVKKQLLAEVREMARTYKGTPGLLCYLVGNENNYGLFWDGSETEDIPEPEEVSTARAEHLYRRFNDSARAIKKIDSSVPVAIVNGDLLFMDLFDRLCPDVDIFGVNTYRGPSFTTLFDRVEAECTRPMLLTEFGSDAFNVLTGAEEEEGQAFIDAANWVEILLETERGRCLGGCTFQFSDEWWKLGQEVRLTEHDTAASWHNGGYYFDFVAGQENMNEEWFGICAKEPATVPARLYDLRPREAYYALKALFTGE